MNDPRQNNIVDDENNNGISGPSRQRTSNISPDTSDAAAKMIPQATDREADRAQIPLVGNTHVIPQTAHTSEVATANSDCNTQKSERKSKTRRKAMKRKGSSFSSGLNFESASSSCNPLEKTKKKKAYTYKRRSSMTSDEEEEYIETRKKRNLQSAMDSRARRKKQFEEVSKCYEKLKKENLSLRAENQVLKNEVERYSNILKAMSEGQHIQHDQLQSFDNSLQRGTNEPTSGSVDTALSVGASTHAVQAAITDKPVYVSTQQHPAEEPFFPLEVCNQTEIQQPPPQNQQMGHPGAFSQQPQPIIQQQQYPQQQQQHPQWEPISLSNETSIDYGNINLQQPSDISQQQQNSLLHSQMALSLLRQTSQNNQGLESQLVQPATTVAETPSPWSQFSNVPQAPASVPAANTQATPLETALAAQIAAANIIQILSTAISQQQAAGVAPAPLPLLPALPISLPTYNTVPTTTNAQANINQTALATLLADYTNAMANTQTSNQSASQNQTDHTIRPPPDTGQLHAHDSVIPAAPEHTSPAQDIPFFPLEFPEPLEDNGPGQDAFEGLPTNDHEEESNPLDELNNLPAEIVFQHSDDLLALSDEEEDGERDDTGASRHEGR